MLSDILQFMIGLAILGVSADVLIRGAVSLARFLGVPVFVIGLSVVGFGTSAPELAVNLSAAFGGSCDVALGNIVGSNTVNIGLILGLSAFFQPLVAHMRLLWVETPIMIAVALGLWGLSADGMLGLVDGLVLVAAFAVFMGYLLRAARRVEPEVREELSAPVEKRMPVGWAVLAIALGLGGLVGGAHLMVRSATALARGWGMSELTIGLTIVAVGTSLPELASSVAAALRRQPDIALGNVIGSNIFNILFILGLTACIQPVPVPSEALRVDMPVMVGFSVVLFPIMWGGRQVARWEGALLLVCYVGYAAALIVRGA